MQLLAVDHPSLKTKEVSALWKTFSKAVQDEWVAKGRADRARYHAEAAFTPKEAKLARKTLKKMLKEHEVDTSGEMEGRGSNEKGSSLEKEGKILSTKKKVKSKKKKEEEEGSNEEGEKKKITHTKKKTRKKKEVIVIDESDSDDVFEHSSKREKVVEKPKKILKKKALKKKPIEKKAVKKKPTKKRKTTNLSSSSTEEEDEGSAFDIEEEDSASSTESDSLVSSSSSSSNHPVEEEEQFQGLDEDKYVTLEKKTPCFIPQVWGLEDAHESLLEQFNKQTKKTPKKKKKRKRTTPVKGGASKGKGKDLDVSSSEEDEEDQEDFVKPKALPLKYALEGQVVDEEGTELNLSLLHVIAWHRYVYLV